MKRATKIITIVLVFISICSFVPSAKASVICNAFRYPVLEPQLSNCERVVASGAIPNQHALAYSIKFMMRNHQSLQDPSCALARRPHSPACANTGRSGEKPCPNIVNPEWVRDGIENNCSFLVNDLTRPWNKNCKDSSCRTTGYYIDLCATKSKDLVSSFYFNGAPGKRFDDTPTAQEHGSSRSVLAGAFKIDATISDFHMDPQSHRSLSNYAAIKSRHHGRVPALHMVGLNSSNNTTDFDKPLHVSAYTRGLGCPGVAESTVEIMERIANSNHGSTLYMAYAGKDYEQSGRSCQNEPAQEAQSYDPVQGRRDSSRSRRAN